jgi:hypothetical protein
MAAQRIPVRKGRRIQKQPATSERINTTASVVLVTSILLVLLVVIDIFPPLVCKKPSAVPAGCLRETVPRM